MDKESYYMRPVEFTKEAGVIIKEMAKASKNLLIALFIKETMLTANLKDVGDTNGKTDKYMKVNGKME